MAFEIYHRLQLTNYFNPLNVPLHFSGKQLCVSLSLIGPISINLSVVNLVCEPGRCDTQ